MRMSFEKMKTVSDQEVIHERSCMMLYYFTPAELKQIQMVARMAGVGDQIILGMEHGECTLQAILDNQLTSSTDACLKQKAIIFNNISSTRISAFIEGLKKFRMNRPLIAVVTETSIKWTLKELLLHLNEQHHAVKNNQFNEH